MEFFKTYSSFIGGKFIDPEQGKIRKDCNPSNGELLAELSFSDASVLDTVVDTARTAYGSWGKSTKLFRAGILNKMADVMESNKDYLASIEARDVGKPIEEAKLQMEMCISEYKYFAASILSQDDTLVTHDNGSMSAVLREPLGVVGIILPWNAPAMLLSWKVAPALAAGNCVIVKPASAAPLIILELARLWADVIPAGVFNVILATGDGVGDALLNHKGIDKFSFTGSTAVGKHVGSVTGGNIVPCTLELGGKSANIIFEDAQIDRALQYAMLGILSTQGEICVGGSRLLLHESIYDKFLDMIVKKFEALSVGDPMNPANQIGPMIDEKQMNKVLEYIEIGKQEGARLMCGGTRVTSDGRDKGFFVAPTIFADVDNNMRIAREEIFGPVLCVMKFKDEEEAIHIANDSEYGLGAGVWTRNLPKAFRVGKALQAGTVWVNDYLTSTPGNPFGGYKRSGIGREIHKMALDNYSNVKNLCICPDENVPEFF
ncbi:acyl-CoA reductase-like NAD-dependent aldehyde dehydrogenase [Catenibacillus scindens]|uniref:Acyl-CoA reductase-like NAD-dependent aldehyde dehydrogenase n=1 Tax=Catenibacillus scindens TaxID=673271 RepID=A0A7W8HD95_9FIRM|nr:aldehyde dehydrogenase family protein [Catenibacillus scindens]MBB5265557.1 acyl-CoA reductase-like NAD-dependent aldehyde dehydrogenase [Catenibacillus scindens]